MNCVLSYSGLIVSEHDEDYLLSEIIERFKKTDFDEKSCEYDESKGILTINMDYHNFEIKFNDKQKALFEKKSNDLNIKQLQQLFLEYEKEVILHEVREGIEEGVYPTDKKTVSIYAESLDKEVVKTGANVVKKGLRAAWPFLLIGVSIPMWMTPATNDWSTAAQVIAMLTLLGMDTAGVLGIGARLVTRFVEDSPSRTYRDFMKSVKELIKNLKRKKDLNEHKKEVEEELKAESFTDFVQKEDDKDNAKVKAYKDQFLNEFNAVVTDLNKLPDEKQRKYRERLSSLLTDYQNRVNSLLEKGEGEVVLGEAEDVWQIFVELLPELNKISFDLAKELKAVYEREEFNAEVQEIQQTLTGGYTEGYTDGYTDDLTSGGVAYQRKG